MIDSNNPFTDNLARLDVNRDPLQWNLNKGLQSLCEQMDRIERQQQALAQLLQAALQTRSPG